MKKYQTIIKGIPYYAIYPDKRPFFNSRNIDIYLMVLIGRKLPCWARKQEGLTLGAIGDRYGVTRSRIRDIYLKMDRCVNRNIITIKEGEYDL